MNAGIKYEEQNTDIKAEVLASYFIEEGMDLDNIFITPAGLFKRPYSKDILNIGYKPEKSELSDCIFIEISRDGLYDLLPEGLFHQPEPGKSKKSTQEIIDEIRKSRQDEEAAREFFLSIEKELYRARILLETEERKSVINFSRYFKKKMYFSLWENLSEVSEEYLPALFQLLPISHKVAGDIELTEICFKSILGEHVKIKTGQADRYISNTSASNTLGCSSLGTDFIIGNTFTDYGASVEVIIGPLQKNNLMDYLHAGKAANVLKVMGDYFFPVDATVTISTLLNKKEEELILSDHFVDARLGYTSTI